MPKPCMTTKNNSGLSAKIKWLLQTKENFVDEKHTSLIADTVLKPIRVFTKSIMVKQYKNNNICNLQWGLSIQHLMEYAFSYKIVLN